MVELEKYLRVDCESKVFIKPRLEQLSFVGLRKDGSRKGIRRSQKNKQINEYFIGLLVEAFVVGLMYWRIHFDWTIHG